MAYIFLDESGQFTKKDGGKYFIVGSFTVGDPKRTKRELRKWYTQRFPKKIKNQSEIKFSATNIDTALKLNTIKHISSLDVRIHFVYLLRSNIPNDFRKKDRVKSGELYTHIIGELVERYLPVNDNSLRIFCDQRHLKGIKRSQFKSILKAHLLPLLPKNTNIQIEMLDSATNKNIQIADWITGAIAHYLEGKEYGEDYYGILKNNIIDNGLELFKDHWINKTNKKLNKG